MTGTMNENTRKAAEIKAQKRAAALRENLKRRKNSEAVLAQKGDKDEKPENRE